MSEKDDAFGGDGVDETAAVLRPLTVLKYYDKTAIKTSPLTGERAELVLLPLDCLGVDDRFQRPITAKGRQNVRQILEQFDWRKFAPVIVAKAEDGRFSIIDGQHRATAALMHPDIDMVPCMVIKASPEEAAECFAAINGQVTALTLGQIFHARLAAREKNALAVKAACDAGGVKILKHKAANDEYETGQTMAIGTIERCYRKYGNDVLVTALVCITETGDGNPGCLRAGLISALCHILAHYPAWREAGGALLDAIDAADLYDVLERSRTRSQFSQQTVTEWLSLELIRHLFAELGPGKAAKEKKAA